MNAIDLLKAAKAKVEAGWLQGYWAKTNFGTDVVANDPAACAYCLYGGLYATLNVEDDGPALFHLNSEDRDALAEAEKALQKVVGTDLVGWNDAEGRTQAEVVNAFENAIVQLEIRG